MSKKEKKGPISEPRSRVEKREDTAVTFEFRFYCSMHGHTHIDTGFLLHCAWWESHNENGDARWDISGVYKGPNTNCSSLAAPPSLPSLFQYDELQHEADRLPRHSHQVLSIM